ncbi:autophagy-related protein 3 [Momordica charantia]|uniref:Autophagy-related protein 3 n=1 Tax=Momordica charantia TaxID=3673 RepID=A0A6J1CI24_MOMCH|nr:autophagy-related protein 3 [Momordica charantia]
MANWLKGFKGMVEKIKSSLKISQSKESLVVLTVPEFIAAGDHLIAECPDWSWDSGELSKVKSYLPSHKQFLVTRSVSCLRRASSYEDEYMIVGDDGEDDSRPLFQENPTESVEEVNLHSLLTDSYFGVGNKEYTPDMEKCIGIYSGTQDSTHPMVHEPEDNDVASPRTYDISITYDRDYQTPRFWLTGYHKYRMCLEPELILEDVRRDLAGKTVTIEDHPHLLGKHASVHPRYQGAAVKKMVDDCLSRGIELEVRKYLLLFLKSVASVFPSIDFGDTIDFELKQPI